MTNTTSQEQLTQIKTAMQSRTNEVGSSENALGYRMEELTGAVIDLITENGLVPGNITGLDVLIPAIKLDSPGYIENEEKIVRENPWTTLEVLVKTADRLLNQEGGSGNHILTKLESLWEHQRTHA